MYDRQNPGGTSAPHVQTLDMVLVRRHQIATVAITVAKPLDSDGLNGRFRLSGFCKPLTMDAGGSSGRRALERPSSTSLVGLLHLTHVLSVINCRTIEAAISKKWYNLFVSLDPAGAVTAEDSQSTVRNPAQTVAEIASSVAVEPKFTGPVSPAAGFEEIYRAAEIQPPGHGYTIMKIADMLQSERIRTLPAEVKKSSVLLALDAAGVKIEEVIEDAVKRDRALDGFERVQQKALDDLERRKDQENQEIQADLDRLVQEHNARIQANKDEIGKEKERFYAWRLQKQQEEQKISDSVSYFVVENPITTGGVAAASRGTQTPSKAPAPKR